MAEASNQGNQRGGPRLHGDLLSTSLLAFLKSASAYGYQLTQLLTSAGLPQFDSGTVYRTLRQLEKDGLVSSAWDTSESGPARRMYTLTDAGTAFLDAWIDALKKYQNVLFGMADAFIPRTQPPGGERPSGEPETPQGKPEE
jgi:poly-beta-hydroxybutyrate-responsive repressor